MMWSSPLLLAVLYRSPPPPSHAPSHPLMRLTGRCMLRLAVADDDNDGVLDPDASPALLRRLAIAPNHRALKLALNDNCPKGEPSSNQSPVRCEVPGPQHNTALRFPLLLLVACLRVPQYTFGSCSLSTCRLFSSGCLFCVRP